jgi:hypothetical protein
VQLITDVDGIEEIVEKIENGFHSVERALLVQAAVEMAKMKMTLSGPSQPTDVLKLVHSYFEELQQL